MLSFLEVAKRAETGPMSIADDFSMQRVAMKVSELEKKYGLKYDPKVRVNCDDDLADRAWQAGRELLLQSGLYSINSRRMIVFDEREIDETLAAVTPAFTAGEKLGDPVAMYLADIFTVTANLAGLPALTLPIGRVNGLPVGGQLIGPPFLEDEMLEAAFTIERGVEAEAEA